MSYSYITCASGEGFIKNKAQYAVRSILDCGISRDEVHVAVNTKDDRSLFRKLVPNLKNIHVLRHNVDKYKWGYMGGKRKYAPLKPAGILKAFPGGDTKPIIMFDGDVLWYEDPTAFFSSRSSKTWFHHGKGLEKRAGRGKNTIRRDQVNMTDLKSLSKWCRYAFAYLLVKYGVDVLPEREVNSGLYILHPRDQVDLPTCDLEGCDILASNKTLRKHSSAGEQCSLNAALCKLKTNWHGGSRFFCLDHEKYFDHFFGDIEWKNRFDKKLKMLGYKK